MLSHTSVTGMSLVEVAYFLENEILVSDRVTRQFIARNKRYVLDGAFKDCISRGRKWKLAFETQVAVDAYLAKHYGPDAKLHAYSYPCNVHGFHVSMVDQGSIDRGWVKSTMEDDADTVSVADC